MAVVKMINNKSQSIQGLLCVIAYACKDAKTNHEPYLPFPGVYCHNAPGNTIPDKRGNGMIEKKLPISEQQRRHLIEKMWLNFYNDHLLKEGIITDAQHKKMQAMIISRKPSALS